MNPETKTCQNCRNPFTIDLLEMFGNRLGHPHTKKIERDLFELRIRGGQDVRLFYTFRKGEIIVLSGFVKKSSRIPKSEIETARRRIRRLTRYNAYVILVLYEKLYSI